MTAQQPPAGHPGFWLALIIGCLCLFAGLVNPVTGLLYATCYFAFAWGIRRGQPWAALAGAGLILFPLLRLASRAPRLEFSVSLAVVVLIEIAVGTLLLRAGFLLRRASAAVAAWPFVLLLCLFGFKDLCFQPYIQATMSMAPILAAGDQLLVETATWAVGRMPQRGDIVVFYYPLNRKDVYVKRVVGIPGDRLRLRDKRLYRDGSPVDEPYAIHSSSYVDSYRDNFPAAPNAPLPARAQEMLQNHVSQDDLVVPTGNYFVMGDNRDDSLDSRYFGFVPRADIIGRPVLIYGSNDTGGAGAPQTPTVLNERWGRLFKIL